MDTKTKISLVFIGLAIILFITSMIGDYFTKANQNTMPDYMTKKIQYGTNEMTESKDPNYTDSTGFIITNTINEVLSNYSMAIVVLFVCASFGFIMLRAFLRDW